MTLFTLGTIGEDSKGKRSSGPEDTASGTFGSNPSDGKQSSGTVGGENFTPRQAWTSPKPDEEEPRAAGGKKRKVKGADLPPYSDWFEKCWEAYPRKVGKGAAWRAFHALNQEGLLPPDMVSRIEYRALEDDWNVGKDSSRLQYVPHMATWLHRRGWEDEGCAFEPDPRNTPEDERRNEIMGKYNFGMPVPGESTEQALEKNERMIAELEAEGL